MTGTQAGAIDFDWLKENIRVSNVLIEAADEGEDEGAKVPTFCFDHKALPAAEQFLLARYTLHEQVYFHKTTRCVEAMIGKLLKRVSDLAAAEDASKTDGAGARPSARLQFYILWTRETSGRTGSFPR